MSEKVIESTTAESITVTIKSPSDPTAGAVEFAVTSGATEPSGWVAGSWSGSWSAVTSLVEATSPIVGNGQALTVDPATLYDLWVRFTAGTETPVKHVGRLRVV